MSPLLLQILFYTSGTTLIIVAICYAWRPVSRALHRRKINELPKIDAFIAQIGEPELAGIRHELPCTRANSNVPVSAARPERKEPAIRPGLLTKTEKVHFIH